MSYRREKEESGKEVIIIDGWEKGISPSPHTGIGNLQGVNIAAIPKEVMCSFIRNSQLPNSSATFTITPIDGSHVSIPITNAQGGTWISVSNSTISGLANGSYYIVANINPSSTLSSTFKGTILSTFGATGSATATLLVQMNKPVQAATETYFDVFGIQQNRYYIGDINGHVWVYDTGDSNTGNGLLWALIDIGTLSASTVSGTPNLTGLAVYNGYLFRIYGNTIDVKSTSRLGFILFSSSAGWYTFTSALNARYNANHYAYVSRSNNLYYCDTSYVGSLTATSITTVNQINIWSYGISSFSNGGPSGSALFTITQSTNNQFPVNGQTMVFDTFGTMPVGLTAGQVYFVINASTTNNTFQVSTTVGGATIGPLSGGSGNLTFNSFAPTFSASSTYIFTPQALQLPPNESTQALCELVDKVIVGCRSNNLYQWDQIAPGPNNFIPMPESNVTYLLPVSNVAYIFAGNKGNIYVTSGFSVSAVITIPDYAAGIAGTEASYVEPYFVWGGVAYMRGRVYFSILDQTSIKAGNCGGIWSFAPTQNYFIQQDIGVQLRQENQSSYGTYSGYCPVLLANTNQNAIAPQFWSFWQSSVSSPTYGIDYTGTTPQASLIETDLIPTGGFFVKHTHGQLEYKLAAPLVAGETITADYRVNGTDSWLPLPTAITESATGISGYFQLNFSLTQWTQFRIHLNPVASINSSFCRLKDLRLRKV